MSSHHHTHTADRLGTFVLALIATVVVLLAVAWVGHEVRQVLDTVTTALDGVPTTEWMTLHV